MNGISQQAVQPSKDPSEANSDKTAICLSGGGVRSAAFSIGVLQGLDAALQEAQPSAQSSGGRTHFAYLSTVSGGGFAGAWYRTRLARGECFTDALRQLAKGGGYLDGAASQLSLYFVAKLLLYWLFAVPLLWTGLLGLAALWTVLKASLSTAVLGASLCVQVFLALAMILVIQLRAGRHCVAALAVLLLSVFVAHLLIFPPPGYLRYLIVGGLSPALAWGYATRLASSPEARWVTRSLGKIRLFQLVSWLSLGLLALVAGRALKWILTFDPCNRPDAFLKWIAIFCAWTLLAGMMPARWTSLATEYQRRIERGFRLKDEGRPSRTLPDFQEAPALVVNAAASIAEKSHREWDERKSAHFAWGPKGYVDLRDCETPKDRFDQPNKPASVDLAVALATSAAVAGPRMGSYTAKPFGLLMSFFNVRLGPWFRLPSFTPQGTLWGLLWRELNAPKMTTSEWVHLTDGGHFENLGLYEMVRLRCRYILVVDASADPGYTFSDFANAVRKIWIDLGVRIELNGLRLTEDHANPVRSQGQRIYGGVILYPKNTASGREDFEFGKIAYVKASLVGDEPADVACYADLHPRFPHETTADQWFTESQFESYRRLGQFTISSALQRYEATRGLVTGAEPSAETDPAQTIIHRLREVAIMESNREELPTHGGVIVCVAGEPRRFLLVESTRGGDWVLPKGHIERGETPLSCAKRELQEEAGIIWPERCDPVEAVFSSFTKRDEEVRCLYYLLKLEKLPEQRSPDPREHRREILVTTDEYYRALAHHAAAPEGAGKRKRRKKSRKGLLRPELEAARTLAPDLLWVLEEAERKLKAPAVPRPSGS